ncbi:hypothetical protein [Levilactobacillus fujinensis]|uniref:Uncharacterized protein n=1 Tax=Levilactobacillus fujinensis TaxID=2486024 RepID=A0ABW1TBR8_9LACO|nr:hypothetical protein [Levilactobacillus fujinensis]
MPYLHDESFKNFLWCHNDTETKIRPQIDESEPTEFLTIAMWPIYPHLGMPMAANTGLKHTMPLSLGRIENVEARLSVNIGEIADAKYMFSKFLVNKIQPVAMPA